ncbi:zinc finger protein 665-like [Esox lucius]|uniref:Uncharacterized protein n=1 Tax=Esox lucius TaxID=8010 RepID=A0A3P8XF72_ESOLU|nr:zinc finger protein 665-like [Esox lucius]
MSKLQLLNVYVTQRLNAAATEITIAVETTVAELHEEISRSKEEINRLRELLNLNLNPKIKLQKSDCQQLTLPRCEKVVPHEQQHCVQEWSPKPGPEDPYPTPIKEEEEERRISQDEEQLQSHFDIEDSIFTPPCVRKNCDQENPSHPTHGNTPQTVTYSERERLPTNTEEEIKTEPEKEDYRASQLTVYVESLCEVNPDCSAALSENKESENVVQIGGLTSGLKSKRKLKYNGESFHTSAGGRTDTENMIDHLQTPTEKNHSCHVGDNFFSRKRCHTGEKPHFCNACDKCFSIKGTLPRHSVIHPEKISFRCQECGKFFTQKSSLSNHMLIHRGLKPYQCKICGKCFTQTGSLSRHMRAHTGEKPHQCQECGKRFTQRVNLSSHMKIHRGAKR